MKKAIICGHFCSLYQRLLPIWLGQYDVCHKHKVVCPLWQIWVIIAFSHPSFWWQNKDRKAREMDISRAILFSFWQDYRKTAKPTLMKLSGQMEHGKRGKPVKFYVYTDLFFFTLLLTALAVNCALRVLFVKYKQITW